MWGFEGRKRGRDKKKNRGIRACYRIQMDCFLLLLLLLFVDRGWWLMALKEAKHAAILYQILEFAVDWDREYGLVVCRRSSCLLKIMFCCCRVPISSAVKSNEKRKV